MLRHTRRAKIIRAATYGQHQRIVFHRALFQHHRTIGGLHRAKHGLAVLAIHRDHLTRPEIEIMPASLRHEADTVILVLDRASRKTVQHGFPDMRETLVDQGNAGLAAFTERFSQPGCQCQPRDTAANDEDF